MILKKYNFIYNVNSCLIKPSHVNIHALIHSFYITHYTIPCVSIQHYLQSKSRTDVFGDSRQDIGPAALVPNCTHMQTIADNAVVE